MRVLLLLGVLLLPATAAAGAWTRDRGHFYANLSYSRISTNKLFSLKGPVETFGSTYTQHVLGHYAEVGIVSRWLTATVEWQAYRNSSIANADPASGLRRAMVDGIGDLRLGAWSGLVIRPVRFAVGVIAGFPTGDPRPQAGAADEMACEAATREGRPSPSCDRVTAARSLPTGDGEFDLEVRTALGHSFGGWRYWPLQHYVVAEAGLWFRSKGFPHDFTYKAELGIKFPWTFIDRFWFIARLAGIEAFVTPEMRTDPNSICQGPAAFSGLGACVAYTAYGFDVFGRIVRGLGASIGLDSAFRAHLVPAGANLRVSISYEY
jgi:hypothetical protein